MQRATDYDPWNDQDQSPMTWDEKLFLAVCAYLLLKGLLKPSEASDRRRVRYIWDRLQQRKPPEGFASESRLP